MTRAAWRVVAILAVTQIVAWGAMFYAIAIVAPAIARDLGLSQELAYGAFSWSLLVAGLVSTPAGMLLDRCGGRPVMAAGSAIGGVGLLWLGQSTGPLTYFGAWTVLGVAMALTLYEAAFATINRKFADDGRSLISTLTLFAGFASTLAWPLTWYLSSRWGWRSTYLWFGLAQLMLCLPLHLLLGADPPRAATRPGAVDSVTLRQALRQRTFWMLACAFAVNTLIFSTLSVHLMPLIRKLGHPADFAVRIAMLIGPMQVAGRVLERTLGRGFSPQAVGALTFAVLPAALLVCLLFGAQAWAVAVFCALYGLSNGVITIVRGTIPRTLFGHRHYGAISGAMAAPSMLAKAAGPLAGALVVGASATPTALLLILAGCALLAALAYYAAVAAPTGQANYSLRQHSE